MVEKFLAKSVMNGGTSLLDHSKAVTNFSAFVFENTISRKLTDTTEVDYDDIKNSIILAASMHDIGKCYSEIQNYLNSPKPKRGF